MFLLVPGFVLQLGWGTDVGRGREAKTELENPQPCQKPC